MKASFFQRLGAYIIDTIIVGVISSIVFLGIPATSSTSADAAIQKLTEEYISGEIEMTSFYNEYNNLIYESHKEMKIETIVSLVLTVGYFVVFQYMNKGKTVGKSLLNIAVVDEETKEPATMKQGIIRSLIVLGIATTAIDLVLIMTANKSTYMETFYVLSAIESLFILVSAIFIAARQDGRGLHDLMAKTSVIKEGR